MNLEQLRSFKPQIQALARAYRIDPNSIRVFGSVARGSASAKSDIDLLVHPLAECSAFDLGGFYMGARALFGDELDVVSDRGIHPKIAPFILADVVPL